MSGDRGWEDLFGSLDDGESAAEPAEQGTTDPDPFGFDLPPAAAAPVTPTPAPAVPYVLPEPAGVADPPADPFAAMRARQAAAQRAAADAAAAAAPAPATSAPTTPAAPAPDSAAPAAGAAGADSGTSAPPLTRRELRELERTGQTGAVDVSAAAAAATSAPSATPPQPQSTTPASTAPAPAAPTSTTPDGSAPDLVEPPAPATLTGPVFAAAWSAAAPPAAATVDADVPPPAAEPVEAAGAAQAFQAPAPRDPLPPTQPVSWSPAADQPAAGQPAASQPIASQLSASQLSGSGSTTPTVSPDGSASSSEPAPAWFAAAEAVAEPEAPRAGAAAPAAAAVPPAGAAAAAATVGAAAAGPMVRTSGGTALEDWRPRPVAGGGFPIPITVGGGAGGSGGSGGGTGGVSSGAPRRRRSKRWLAILIPILVVLGLVGAAGVWAWSNYEDKIREVLGWELPNDYESTGNGQEVVVTIRSGDIGADIARTLHDAGVTMTFDAFYDLLLEQDPEPVFEAGNYTLQQQMSAQSALTALQDPANRLTSRLVIPEGSVLPDTLAIMSSTTGIPIEEFEAASLDLAAYGLPAQAPSLEGYLFPATYELDGTETASGLIQRLVTETFTRLDALGVPVDDRHRVLTLAGLIQRESGPVEGDPAKIARVFLNRLDQGMNLESDATVAYGTGNLHTVWTTSEDRADASNPYNTYANPGLPIGPIGAPGEVAIQAVLAPADGPWLYFVPINLATGETMFSETFDEHQAWVDVLWEWCEASDENAAYCA